MNHWQPIATAPKDGTKLLIFDGDEIYAAAWREASMGLLNKLPDKDWVYASIATGDWNYYKKVYNASHWMPLPEPPKKEEL